MVWLSGVMKWLAPNAAVAAIVAFIAYQRATHTDWVRKIVDPLKLKIPVFGPLFRKVYLARMTRNLASMLSAGVPMLLTTLIEPIMILILGAVVGSILISLYCRSSRPSTWSALAGYPSGVTVGALVQGRMISVRSSATPSGSLSMCRWLPSTTTVRQPRPRASAISSAYVSPNAI